LSTPNPSRSTASENYGRRAQLTFAVFALFYIALMLLCLRQWDSPRSWSRLDRFSGGYILLSILWLLASLRFMRMASGNQETGRELAGQTFHPELFRWIKVLAFFDLLALVDYGHWHLCPALENPVLQSLGLVISVGGCLWLLWTDHFLLAHFSAGLASRKIIEDGPYRIVRHPRYLALTVSRIAFALILASIIAWLLFAFWMLVILRRIHREEPHLRKIFGPQYETYAQRTPRLFPGIY
jgi:protein-S-isoprenylcysteine O-methyltransferase Ste14